MLLQKNNDRAVDSGERIGLVDCLSLLKYKTVPWKLVLTITKESRSASVILEKKLKNLNSEDLLKFIQNKDLNQNKAWFENWLVLNWLKLIIMPYELSCGHFGFLSSSSLKIWG